MHKEWKIVLTHLFASCSFLPLVCIIKHSEAPLHTWLHTHNIIYIYHCKPTQLERPLSACLLTSCVLWTTLHQGNYQPSKCISSHTSKARCSQVSGQYYIWTIILLCFWAWQVTYTAPLCFHTGLEYCFTRFRSGLLLDLPHTWHHTGLMAALAADLSCSKDRLHATHSLRMLLHHTTPLLEH